MALRERLITCGLVTGAVFIGVSSQIESFDQRETNGGCKVDIYISENLQGGRTYPAVNFRNSVIFVNPDPTDKLLKHEMGHADQLCEQGFGAVTDWATNNEAHEEDATRRGEDY